MTFHEKNVSMDKHWCIHVYVYLRGFMHNFQPYDNEKSKMRRGNVTIILIQKVKKCRIIYPIGVLRLTQQFVTHRTATSTIVGKKRALKSEVNSRPFPNC